MPVRVLVPLLAIGVAALVWMQWPRPVVDLPRLSHAEILALTPDEAGRRSLIVHLSSVLLGNGKRLASWHSLPGPAQHVYTTLNLELVVEPLGIIDFNHALSAGSPGYADVADGYAAMGCGPMAELLRDAAKTLPTTETVPPDGWAGGFMKRFHELLPAGREARFAYQEIHVDDL